MYAKLERQSTQDLNLNTVLRNDFLLVLGKTCSSVNGKEPAHMQGRSLNTWTIASVQEMLLNIPDEEAREKQGEGKIPGS